MRREGYELAVSRPRAVVKEVDGQQCEPYETLAVDLDESTQGAVMQALGERGGQLTGMHPDGKGRVRLDYNIPSRGLIGFQTEFRTMTSGLGLMHHIFDHFGPVLEKEVGQRQNGVLISNGQGESTNYALWYLEERGALLIDPGIRVYEGMIVGEHSRENDLVVNVVQGKKLTNVRASGKDDALILTPPLRLTLERAMSYITDDELVEVTPKAIRLRKRWLDPHVRKKMERTKEAV
jgi:GTP-binding protein